jgi:hypothetical protein
MVGALAVALALGGVSLVALLRPSGSTARPSNSSSRASELVTSSEDSHSADAQTSQNRRISELLHNSETSGLIGYESEQCPFEDKPSHLTPERVHGGVGQ